MRAPKKKIAAKKGSTTLDFAAVFPRLVERLKVGWSGDREKTVGASEIGQCARKIGYRKHGVKPDPEYVESGGFALRGDVMENNALAPLATIAVEAVGGKLLWAGQNDQMRIVDEDRYVSATPDGLAADMPLDALSKYGVPDLTDGSGLDEERCFYVELKSIDPRLNEDKLPKVEHVDQVNLGLGLVRETEFEEELTTKPGAKAKFVTSVYRPNYGVIVYMNASDYSVINVFVVKFDAEGFSGQLARAKHIMTVKDPELLRPEGKMMGGKDCRYCEFSKRCTGYAALVPKEVQAAPPKVVTRVRQLSAMWQKVKSEIETLTDRQKAIEGEIKEEMAAAKTKYVGEEDDFSARWSSVAGKTSYKGKEMYEYLKSLGEDVSKWMTQGKPSERLTVEYVGALA